MTTLYSLTLAQATANLRTDLNDPTGAGSRWADTDLQRALDRTVERITSVEPDLEEVQLATVKQLNVYAKPAGALWIDRVEYPADQWPHNYPSFTELRSPTILPPAQPTISLGAGGALGTGNYNWECTFVAVGGGETTASNPAFAAATAGQSALVNVPLGPPGTQSRNIYRTAVGGSTYKLLGTLQDNTTAQFLDTNPDGALINQNPPATNTTGGIDVFRLEVPPEQYPPDNLTYTIKVRYALKHELDTLGTTIPERHWDALYRGAMVAAVDIYLANINDNFIYADGQLRDRVDDTKSVEAWRAWRELLEQAFIARLKQIRDEQVQSARFTPNWGDKPLRWEKT